MPEPIRETAPAAVHASRNAEPIRPRVVRGMVIGVVAAVLLAAMGAFNTDAVALLPRLTYWLAVILPGSALGLLIAGAVQAWGRLARWRWLEIFVAALLVALPHTFIVVVASAITFGADRVDAATVLAFFGIVLPVSLVLTAINYVSAPIVVLVPMPLPEPLAPPQTVTPAPPTALNTVATIPAAFAERLPQRLRAGRLLALAAEDHYLRVHTDTGNELVLMRMADAVAMLAEIPGARVHRSWWVAHSAVEGQDRDGDRLFLRLSGGLSVPVSRSMRREMAKEGWLPD